MAATTSRSVHTTWLYTLSSIVFFVGFYAAFTALMMLEHSLHAPGPLPAVLIVLQLVAGAAQIRYCWFLRVGLGGGLPAAGWTAAMLGTAAAVWVLGLFVSGAAVLAAAALWGACSLIACLLPSPVRWLLLGASAVAYLGHAVIATTVLGEPFAFAVDSGAWATSVYALVLPLMLITSVWWWEIVVKLDRHRRVAAELAVTQERLRFASDLHDIQGHHLQVISLKSELAERLLDRDPDAARENIHEVRLIAKEALEETRSLVAGYRQVALADELENAREVLTAAGADCDLRIVDQPADATARSALASVVREATTNILRHSSARRVSISLSGAGDRFELVIVNDGVTGESEGAGAAGTGAAGTGTGSGLAGLRERLAAVGGSLQTSSDAAAARFELRATVPATAEVPA